MKSNSEASPSYEYWLPAAISFWILLAFCETGSAVLFKLFVSKTFPGRPELWTLLGAFSIYGLISVPTSIFLYAGYGALCRLNRRMRFPLHAPSPMDVVLIFGWTLLVFKIIAIVLPHQVHSDHLPNSVYLLALLVPVIYAFLIRRPPTPPPAYRIEWIALVLLFFFISKDSYTVFITSTSSILLKIFAFPVYAFTGILAGLLFNSWIQILGQLRPPKRFALTFLILVFCLASLYPLYQKSQKSQPDSYRKTDQPIKTNAALPSNRSVVVVMVDCLRADHMASYGYDRVTSPFVDELARDNVLVSSVVAPSSWTLPSVSSFFTGVYPQQHGVNALGDALPKELETIQSVMAHRGINTAAFVTNDFLKPEHGFARGFQYYFDRYLNYDLRDRLTSKLFFLNAIYYFKNEILYPDAVDPGSAKWWSTGMPPFNHRRISAGKVTDDVLSWLKQQHDQPFYLYVHFMDVHSPYDTYWYPLFDAELYDRQDTAEKLSNIYDGRILYVDGQIRRIWETLKELNLTDTTMMIVTSDHGEEIYEHGGVGHCTTLYEEMVKIPIVMHVPTLSKLPVVVKQPTSGLTIPATIMDFLQLPPLEHMVGKSILNVLEAPSDAPDESVYILSYTSRGRKSLKTEEGRKLFFDQRKWDQGIVLKSIHLNNDWKLIVGDDGRKQLFNLKEDPEERRMLAPNNQPMFEILQKKLNEIDSQLKTYLPEKSSEEITPEMKNQLKALGYMS